MLNDVNVFFWEKIHSSKDLGIHKNNDYNARCDICGDSKTSVDKKRLHLFKKESYDEDMVKCFNCGFTSNMFSYIRNYHNEYFEEYKKMTSKKVFDSILPRIKKNIDDKIPEIDIGINLENYKNDEIEYKDIPKKFLNLDVCLRKASEYKEASNYILGRGANPDDFYFCENGLAGIDEKLRGLKEYIIYPFTYIKNDNPYHYGFYSRNIKEKTFRTYLPEENTGFKVADWFKLDLDKEVYIFEGIFCKLCSGLENSIAMCGSNMPKELLEKIKKPIFVYDNDERGFLESYNVVKNNKNVKVCIWGDDKDYKRYKDINDLYIATNGSVDIKNFINSHIDDGFTALTRLELLKRFHKNEK